jgi:hypothetical protein
LVRMPADGREGSLLTGDLPFQWTRESLTLAAI